MVANASCGYYSAESGEAFAPWNFPENETRPEFLAVGAALLASSPHNTQPWLFEVSPQRIELYADLSKSLGAMDSQHREMYIGLGCALENLVIAARQHGREATITMMPDTDRAHVASIELTEAAAQLSPLYELIPKRHTNRGRYLDSDPPTGLEEELRTLLVSPDVSMTFLGAEADKKTFAKHTTRATQAIVDDKAMNDASHHWFRHSSGDIEEHRDGIVYDSTVASATIRFLAKISSPITAAEAGEVWVTMTDGLHSTASAFCILSTPDRNDRKQQLACGREYQRMQLWATGEGLTMHPLNQMAERQDREAELGLASDFTEVLSSLTGSQDMGAQMLFRVGYPWEDAYASPRRPTDWVLR